jgi:hypothetical protein
MLATAYDRTVPLLRRLAILVCVLAATGPAAASPGAVVTLFRTPTGTIGCVYSSGLGPPASLRCDIRSRLRPLPPKPPGCQLDWGDSYEVRRTGRAIVVCHGDTAIDEHSRVIRYGSSWTRGGFSCRSRRTGLRCVNASRHWFFLSRQHSYRF